MARRLRLEFKGALYHLTARGNARAKIFLDDTDRKTFLCFLGKEIQQQGWLCYAYCLMDNHYHLLIETPQTNLSQGMRRLNGVYSQAFNRRHHRVGHLLQGRYKSIVVDKESYLLELCRYVVLNPVRAKIVTHERDWQWSSYRATARLDHPPSWLYVSGVLQLLDEEAHRSVSVYRSFVRGGMCQPSPWEEIRGQIFLGGESFLEQMERLAQNQPLDNVPLAQLRPTQVGQELVLERVSTVYGISIQGIISRNHAEAYRSAAYLLRRVANVPLRKVAALFGVSPLRISHIQGIMERKKWDERERTVMEICKVKK